MKKYNGNQNPKIAVPTLSKMKEMVKPQKIALTNMYLTIFLREPPSITAKTAPPMGVKIRGVIKAIPGTPYRSQI